MSDVRGSRFLRMAGGQQFFSDLNKGLQKPMQADSGDSTKMGPNTQTKESSPRFSPAKMEDMPTITPEPTEDDYLNLDQPQTPDSPKVSKGPGSFGKQAEREKFLQDYDIGQGEDTFSMISDIKAINDGLGITGEQLDVDKMISGTIQRGLANDNVDLQALDRHIRMAPLVDEAKSKLHGLNVYGDVARWRTEQLPDFKLPEPMEAVKDPDIEGMANRFATKVEKSADKAIDRLD